MFRLADSYHEPHVRDMVHPGRLTNAEAEKLPWRIARRRWLIRRDKKNLRRRQRIDVRCAGQPYCEKSSLVDSHTAGHVQITADHKRIVVLPKNLDFDDNYEETASHFRALRLAAQSGIRLKRLRFDKIRYISPSAALVLASEVDRWNQKIGGTLKAAVETWDENVKCLLCQMGYFTLLNIPQPTSPPARLKTTFLPFKRERIRAPDSGKRAKELRQEIERITGIKIKRNSLFEGLSEAITNVGHHAYKDATSFTVPQWWLSASYDASERRLCVTFYDQGAGIPKTLPASHIFSRIADYFEWWADSRKIRAAMEVGRTSTELTERGKGLGNLLEFAKAYPEGSLSIYSLKGMYRMNSSGVGDGAVETTECRDYQTSIGGTLIEWSVRL